MIRPFSRLVAVLVAAAVVAPALAQQTHGPRPRRAPAPRTSASASPAVPSASSGPIVPSGGASFDLGIWTVHASSVDANFKTGDFSTPNKIVMTRAGGNITADKADGNFKKQIVNLNGNVVMHDVKGDYGGLNGTSAEHSNGPSTLTADRAEIYGATHTYKAIGHVHYVQADTVVDADNGTLNDTTKDLFLQGNVHIAQGNRNMSAQTVLYNTVTGKAHAEGDVTMELPGQFKRTLATPRPIHIPKNALTIPVNQATAAPTHSP